MDDERPTSGPLIGSLIVIIILVLGALYFLSQRQEPEIPANDTATTTLQVVEPEDSLDAIEQDLSNLDISSLDLDLESYAEEVARE